MEIDTSLLSYFLDSLKNNLPISEYRYRQIFRLVTNIVRYNRTITDTDHDLDVFVNEVSDFYDYELDHVKKLPNAFDYGVAWAVGSILEQMYRSDSVIVDNARRMDLIRENSELIRYIHENVVVGIEGVAKFLGKSRDEAERTMNHLIGAGHIIYKLGNHLYALDEIGIDRIISDSKSSVRK